MPGRQNSDQKIPPGQMGYGQASQKSGWSWHQRSRKDEQSYGSQIGLEISHREKRMVEGSYQEKVHQEAQVKNAGQSLGGQWNHPLETLQIIPQHNQRQLLLDSWEQEKD